MTDRIAGEKAAVRARIRAARRSRSEAERQAAGTAIAEALLALPELTAAGAVAVTSALPSEPPTQPLIDALLARGTRVLVPRIEPGSRLAWVAAGPATTWVPNLLGIREPVGPAEPLAAEAVVVPALAVAVDGTRLGQGGGYFDRALAGSSAFRVAAVFDDEVLTDLPAEAHDLRVDAVVTPSRVLRVRG